MSAVIHQRCIHSHRLHTSTHRKLSFDVIQVIKMTYAVSAGETQGSGGSSEFVRYAIERHEYLPESAGQLMTCWVRTMCRQRDHRGSPSPPPPYQSQRWEIFWITAQVRRDQCKNWSGVSWTVMGHQGWGGISQFESQPMDRCLKESGHSECSGWVLAYILEGPRTPSVGVINERRAMYACEQSIDSPASHGYRWKLKP